MLKKTLMASALAMAIAAPSAHALVTVSPFDWTTPFGSFSNMALMSLTSNGPATVYQEVDSSGNIVVGSRFTESGLGYSATYTKGGGGVGNFGAYTATPLDLMTIWINFTDLSGYVTQVTGPNKFQYVFDGGTVNLSYGSQSGTPVTSWFSASVKGLVGSVNDTFGTASNGTTELLALLPAHTATNTFKETLTGNSLDWFQDNNGLFFNARTTNTVSKIGGVNPCPTGLSGNCLTLSVISSGDVSLMRVPEPGSLALAGLGLLGLGALRRRREAQ